MKRIAIDCETNMAHTIIHVAVTQDIDRPDDVRVWRSGEGLWDYLKDADLITAHNGIGFDFPLLNKLWGTKIGLKQAYDTLVVSRLLEPTRDGGHSLDAWGKSLGVAKLDYKATWQWMMNRREEYEGECFDAPLDGLLSYYCHRDVSVLVDLFRNLCDTVSSKGFSSESVLLEHQVAAIINKQEKLGFKLDVPFAINLLSSLKARMSTLLAKSEELYPTQVLERYSEKTGKRLKDEIKVFNIGSRQQLAEKLQELGWKPKKHTEKGSIIVDESVLDEIIKECS